MAGMAIGSTSMASGKRASVPEIRTEDVQRFYRVYAQANGHPAAIDLDSQYLAPGTRGLMDFVKARHITGAGIAAAIEKKPEIFAGARSCAATLPIVRQRLAIALQKLGELYQASSFPPVTIVIGEGRTGGTTSNAGVLMGLETLCGSAMLGADKTSGFVRLIAHEYIHVQQPLAQQDIPHINLLTAALVEGGAEFLGERISGGVGNAQLSIWTKGREREIEEQFVKDQDETDLKKWLWNGPGTPDRPGDLGYWVGYRIVRAYYERAQDKRAAIRDIILMKDPKAFLHDSGWNPGMRLSRS